MVKLCGLWLKASKDGNTFMTGKSGKESPSSFLIFKNTRRRGPNDPDYELFIGENKRDFKATQKQVEFSVGPQQPQTRHSEPLKTYVDKSDTTSGGMNSNDYDDLPF